MLLLKSYLEFSHGQNDVNLLRRPPIRKSQCAIALPPLLDPPLALDVDHTPVIFHMNAITSPNPHLLIEADIGGIA